MTEVDALTMLTEIAQASLSFMSVWISITFAYLTVAYLVGNSLSRFQYLAVTALYIVLALHISTATVTWVKTWEALHLRESTILDEVVISNYPYTYTAIAVFLFGTALSLYFMYNVRKSKKSVTKK
jgi:hypothetical protein